MSAVMVVQVVWLLGPDEPTSDLACTLPADCEEEMEMPREPSCPVNKNNDTSIIQYICIIIYLLFIFINAVKNAVHT